MEMEEFDFEKEWQKITPIKEKLDELNSKRYELIQKIAELEHDKWSVERKIKECKKLYMRSPLCAPDIDEYYTKYMYFGKTDAIIYLNKFDKRVFALPVYYKILDKFNEDAIEMLSVKELHRLSLEKNGLRAETSYKELPVYDYIKVFYSYFNLDIQKIEKQFEERFRQLINADDYLFKLLVRKVL